MNIHMHDPEYAGSRKLNSTKGSDFYSVDITDDKGNLLVMIFNDIKDLKSIADQLVTAAEDLEAQK